MKRYYIETFGCNLNKAESKRYKEILDLFLDYSSLKEADLALINSCGVIQKTELKIIKKIKEYKKAEKFIILTGCLPAISKTVTIS